MRPRALLLPYAVLVLVRMPAIVAHGRFWAEEGAVFFRNAWTLPPLTALFTPYGGYLNLVANAATLLARWTLPLEWAPYMTIAVALLFQLLPPSIWLAARDAWLTRPVRLAGLLLLLLVPASDEVWLQTLHAQFELSLAAGLLLTLDVPGGAWFWATLSTLALAPLAGPGAMALLPLFLLRAALDRAPRRIAQAAALAAGTAVQWALFFSAGSERGLAVRPEVLLPILTVKHLLRPFFGVRAAISGASSAQAALAAGHLPWLAMAAPVAVLLLLAASLWHQRNAVAVWLFAAAALTAGAAYVGALAGGVALISPYAGERYGFVPQSLIGIGLLAMAAAWRGWVSRVAALACLWLLAAGTRDYFRPLPWIADGPEWRTQVALWRADPAHALLLWPPPWMMSLPL